MAINDASLVNDQELPQGFPNIPSSEALPTPVSLRINMEGPHISDSFGIVRPTATSHGWPSTSSSKQDMEEYQQGALGKCNSVPFTAPPLPGESPARVIDHQLAELEVITPGEIEQIWKWNNIVPESVQQCVHEIIKDRALAQPNAPAVCAWDGELTYSKLDQLATRLAGRLTDLGIRPSTFIPLCFEKSMWTMVAMLGVLKAGGAFVMLDPSLPEQRLQAIIDQVKASLVLSSISNQSLSSRLAQGVLTINSDFFSNKCEEEIENQCSVSPSPADVIYVTFTSGSTGTPKGIVVTHTNFASAIYHQVDTLGLTANSRVYDFSSYSFDISVSYALMALATGGCLCVPSDHDRKNDLPQSMALLRANTMVLTPSVAQFLSPEGMPELQLITFVGEVLRIQDARRWWGKVQVLNRYGASECTAACTINCNASCPEEAIRIGKGVGLVTWVVDPENHDYLLPLGRIGELLLEGPLVSSGYLNDPERTAAAFIKDPAWLLRGAPGLRGRHGRLYKTGDLVRYNEDGSLTFIGRKDTQVKIHGQRVELGEIEHHMRECIPEVLQVVVEAIELTGMTSSQVLVAFVQLDGSLAETNQPEVSILPVNPDVQAKLAEHLPRYMIPTVFLSMRDLPRTATGKTDRRQLRNIGGSVSVQQQLAEIRTGGREFKRQPTSEAERSIQNIWARVFNIDATRIGQDDSFFHLGGDSIAAMKVVAEARKVGIKLVVADIFRHPSLHDLANQSVRILHEAPEEIAPFALLGDEADVNSFLRDISTDYHIDLTTIRDAYPCTSLQEGLISLSSKRSGDYIMQAVLELSSNIAVTDLCAAWEEVVIAMPILRTRIIYHNDLNLAQVVLDEPIRWLEATDLESYLEADRNQPMELGQPLSRHALVKDGVGTPKWLVWTVHHALYDDWSMDLITDAVSRACRGDPIRNGPQFQAFIKYIKDQDSEEMSTYWRKELADCECVPFPALPLSIEQPVPDALVHHQFTSPEQRFKNITTSTLIRAAWALIAGQVTSSEDIVFGVTVSGRNAPVTGIDKMAAPTIATVPLRTILANGLRVSKYLEEVQQQSTEMMPFEQVGLNRLARMGPGAWQACKFQTLLVVQPQDNGGFGQSLLGKWSDGSQKNWSDTYALTIELRLGADKIMASASFDSRVLEPWMAQKLLQRLEHVMNQLDYVTPTKVLGDIEVLTPQDLAQIWEWNSIVPAQVERCVHKMIEDKVQAQPSAPAICAWDGELTYNKLDQLAAKLASRLVELGIGPDMLVPLCFEKSMWTTVAILGVIKAGAGFVLLDLSLPEQRLQTIVQQAKGRLIVTSVSNQDLGLRLAKETVVLSWSFFGELGDQNSRHIAKPSPSSILYAIFTSGSTGTPKGVLISHKNIASSLHSQAALYKFGPSTRIFDFASYSFDCSVDNVFLALTAGGCLCVPSDEDRKNNIEQSIVSLHANVLQLTTSVARLLSPDRMPDVHTIVFGGEALPATEAKRWWDTQRVINCYGPSECTPTSTMTYSASSPEEAARIGKGAGLVTWVVHADNHDELLPPGSIGELLLEGPSVGCGYLDDPDRTAAAFVEDPAWLLRGGAGRPGRHAKLYKTGDLVQYNEDGSLSFICRKDDQVKIRGQRVELGEVEHHVRACFPTARQAAAEVIVPGGDGGVPTLAAFLVMDELPEPGLGEAGNRELNDGMTVARVMAVSAEVDHELAARLPVYMVPTVYFALDEFPVNRSGKADRRRLRHVGAGFTAQQLSQAGSETRTEKRAPSTETERSLQQIWARILNIDAASIGADDSFLRLGGDSITAMQVSAAARAAKIDISTADILRKKTISLLAAAASVPNYHPGLDAIFDAQEDNGQPFQLSPIQQLFVASEPDPTRCFDQNFFLKLRAPVSSAAVAKAFETIVSRHPMLRARFNRTGEDRWEQRITNDASASFHVCNECGSRAVGPELASHIRRCRERLNIETGPLLAAVLFDGATFQSLFIAAHHLVIDLVSWRVLLQELEVLLTTGQLPSPPTTSFRAWCSMQAQYVAENLCSKTAVAVEVQPPLLSYWGVDAGANVHSATASTHFVLSEALSTAILGTCNDAFATQPVELMIAALSHSFRTVFTDRSPPPVFSEGHGREPWDDRIDPSRTVGWFTTISPVDALAEAGVDLVDAVRCTKDFIRGMPKNGWSYFTSKFADHSMAVAHASEFPVEIMFNYAGSYQQLERGGSLFESILAPDNCDPASCAGMRRLELFDIQVKIDRGRLAVTLVYPKNARHRERIIAWADQYEATLMETATLLRDRPPEWTLVDFPMAFASYDNINEFRSRLLPQLSITRPEDIEDIYPCTGVQEGILLAQGKDSSNYRVVLKFEIIATRSGDHVDSSRIERAWRAVVRRHSILRAVLMDTMPGTSRTMHIVLKDPEPGISYIQDAAGAAADRFSDSQTCVGYQRYDLQHHLCIDRIDEKRVYLHLEMNHAILDGHSSGVLLRDFWQAYNDNLSPNSPLYSEFIKYVEQQSRAADSDFWMAYLDGVQPCLFPPSIRGREEMKAFTVPVPSVDAVGIHDFCTKWEVTTATVIQTAWALVLRQYTGSTTPCFGNLASGRDVPIEEIEDMFGPVIGMIPCRIQLDGRRSVIETLREVQEEYADGLPHQTYPLLEVHKALRIGPSGLFNSILSFQRSPYQPVQSPDGHKIHERKGQDPVEYPITIGVNDGGTTISIQLGFNAGFLASDQAKRVARALGAALSSLVNGPDTRISDVSLLHEDDIEQLWSWNFEVPAAVEKCVHGLIDEQVRSQPDAMAICAWDGELTYRELDKLACRLVGRLAGLGVKPDTLVPLCFEKSMWTPVAMLGVLKAGGGFVLLDTSLPEQRLQVIVQQLNAPFILASPSTLRLSSRLAETVVQLDSESITFFEPAANSTSQLQPSSTTMFAVFTSGSTGTPKGVVLTHSNFCSGLEYQSQFLGFSKNARVFDFASYAFDISVHNVFATFVSGGCLCIPSEQDRRNDINRAMAEMGVTIANLTPSVARLIDPIAVPQLETLILAGEAVSVDDVTRWWGTARVVNAYGPAECNISTINWEQSSPEESTLIGKGAGLVTWVVDPENHDNLLPPGCIGELLLEGPLVSRGYLNDPEKTAAAFIEDPIWLVQGAPGRPGRHGRLYKTGDLVRYNEDGNLAFIGRKDAQIKIRGQRVELGEIEHWVQHYMLEAKQVVAEIIMPRGENPSPTLVIFLKAIDDAMARVEPETTTAEMLPIPADLEDKLAEHLPRYMLPTALFSMENLPMSSTGKMDRKKLREIGATFSVEELALARTAGRGPKRQPTSDNEKSLQRIWAKILNIEAAKIGVDDGFFNLGGDSIAAMRVVGEARKIGINLAVADVFRRDTIAELVVEQKLNTVQNHLEFDKAVLIESSIKAALLGEIESLNIDIHSGNVENIYPVTNIQEKSLVEGIRPVTSFPEGSLADNITFGQLATYVYIDIGADRDFSFLERGYVQTLEKFPILRSCFLRLRGKFWQVVLRQLNQPLLVQDVCGDIDEYLHDFCLKQARELLPTQPPFALMLARHKVHGMRLIIRMSHAQFDGLCLPIIIQSLMDGEDKTAFPATPSFSTFLSYVSRRRPLSIAYWTELLRGSHPTTIRTQLRPPENIRDSKPKAIRIHAETDLPHRPSNITSATLVSTAWAVLLSRITRADDVVYGHLVSGRNAAIQGVEDIVGCCVNIVPVRVILSTSQTPAELLLSVQEQFLALGEADSLGFKDIIEDCTAWPAGSRFDSIIQHQNIDENPEIRSSEGISRLQWFVNPHLIPTCIYMISFPQGDKLSVQFSANTHIMTMETANTLIADLFSIIGKLVRCVDTPLQSWMDDINLGV